MIKHHVTRKQSQHSSGQNDFLPEISVFPHLVLAVVCPLDVFFHFVLFDSVWERLHMCFLSPEAFAFPWSVFPLCLSTEHILLCKE